MCKEAVGEIEDYMSALEAASIRQDVEPFAAFIAEAVERAAKEFV